MNSVISIGQSGLLAGRGQLDNTAQNVANAMTEWYTRRMDVLVPVQAHASVSGYAYLGGVKVEGLRWLTDAFVNSRAWHTSGQYQQAKVLEDYLTRLDAILGGEHTGYGEPLGQFHRAMERAAANPESITLRQQIISDGGSVADRLVALQNRFDLFHQQMGDQIKTTVDQVNQLLENIARFNDQICLLNQSGSDTADLRNICHKAINQVSELTGASARYDQEDGVYTVYLPGGEVLVQDTWCSHLHVSAGRFGQLANITVAFGRDQSEIVPSQWGGALGGLADFHQVLMAEQASLGMQAALLAASCNKFLAAGYGLDESTGNPLFADLNGSQVDGQRLQPVAVQGDAELSVAIDQSQLSAFQASDYALVFTSASEATVTRLADGHQYTLSQLIPGATGILPFDGLTLTLDQGTAEAGDHYLLTPWRYQAGLTAVVQRDPAKLGFAGAELHKPVGAGPSLGPGDNSVLQKLLKWLRGEPVDGQKLSHNLSSYYDMQVGKVATRAHQANSRMLAERALHDSAMAERDNLFAVNLDEEAANLIRFQQYYQANVKVISAGVTMIDHLLAIL